MILAFLRRLLEGLLALWIIITITFFLIRLLPGGPFDQEVALAPEVKAHLEEIYHLDRPWLEQYISYLGRFAQGDLGESYSYQGKSVNELLKNTLPITLTLGILCLILSFAVGIPWGLVAAARHHTAIDLMARLLAI